MITLDIHDTNSVRLRRVEFKAEETTRGESFSVLEISVATNDGRLLFIKAFSGSKVPVFCDDVAVHQEESWDGEA